MKGVLNSRVVYVLGTADFPVKIGLSDNPHKRIVSLQVGCPDELVLHHWERLPFGLARLIEAAVHREFADRHRRGEWFNVHKDEAVAAVKRISAEQLVEWQYDARSRGDLVDRLHSKFVMAADARPAVLFYRDRAQIKDDPFTAHANGYVLKRCGMAAYAAFSVVIAQRQPLSGLRGSEKDRAEEALASALNALSDFYNDYLASQRDRRLAKLLKSFDASRAKPAEAA